MLPVLWMTLLLLAGACALWASSLRAAGRASAIGDATARRAAGERFAAAASRPRAQRLGLFHALSEFWPQPPPLLFAVGRGDPAPGGQAGEEVPRSAA